MKSLSLKAKITVWVTVLVIIISLISAGSVIFFSNGITQSNMKRNLISAVEGNINEIELRSTKNELKLDDEFDISIEYGGMFIEIDDDFIKENNGVTTAIYDNTSVLYGESIVDTEEFELSEKGIKTVNENGQRYYIYDKKIKNSDSLWLRGSVNVDIGIAQTISIVDSSFLLIPLFAFIAIIGAFLLARGALTPVDKVSVAAEDIRKGSDLTKRIPNERTEKEVHRLVSSFNEMLQRLEYSFEKEKQFNSDVSHELRTPLSVILNECELTLDGAESEEEYKEALKLIERQGKKMNEIISNMLEFARLETGNESITFSETDLSALAELLYEEAEKVNEKGIIYKSDIENNIYINANEGLISRLISNLLSNAYKYTSNNGNITISLKRDGSDAVLSVSDSGCGISKSDINKIFNTFFRADNSRSEEGYGLGLSFVKKIAELHGGEISVKSTEGLGSEFIFRISISEKS